MKLLKYFLIIILLSFINLSVALLLYVFFDIYTPFLYISIVLIVSMIYIAKYKHKFTALLSIIIPLIVYLVLFYTYFNKRIGIFSTPSGPYYGTHITTNDINTKDEKLLPYKDGSLVLINRRSHIDKNTVLRTPILAYIDKNRKLLWIVSLDDLPDYDYNLAGIIYGLVENKIDVSSNKYSVTLHIWAFGGFHCYYISQSQTIFSR